MPTLTVQTVVKLDQVSQLNITLTHSIGESRAVNVSVPDNSTDLLVPFSIDVSELQHITLISDYDITIETNDGTTPQDTINLLAGAPILFNVGDTALFAGDVTALYCTTSAIGATATLQIVAGLT